MDFKKRTINLLDSDPKEVRNIAVNSPESAESIKEKYPRDSYQPRAEIKHPTKKRGRKKLSFFFIFLIILFTVLGSIISSGNSSFLSGVKNSYLIRQISNILSNKEKYLRGEEDDRINFVLLGMGGEGHDGPYLTDTMMVASFKPSTKEAAIFSLPRDMIVPISPNDYRKINSVYSLGQTKDGNGGELVKEVLSKTFGIPIHYYAAVDFQGFVEMIDEVGGVDVVVDKSFTDYQFPTADDKWQEVSFKAGEQEMDGLTALRFARSRHGNNGEGSDFARIKRQQKILLAAKDKITSFNTLINPQKITSLYSLFTKYTSTDLEPWEAVKLVHMSKSMNTQQIVTQSIDDMPGGYLKSGIALDGAYILQPVTGNYQQISALIENIFQIKNVILEEAKIVVQNGTSMPGLALKAVNHLNQMGYNVIRYGNSNIQDKISTVIYSYNKDKQETKESLEAIFQTKVNDNPPLEYSSSVIANDWGIKDEQGNLEHLDFLVILGQDQGIDEGKEIVETIDPLLLNATSSTSTIEIIEE